ncbi:MAG: SDR family NAD(P)-dependent oxidoreductase [Betaproteobacteria bacterium]|nr:SDR family NAD(P)-dependent oxidoreductase [Betaproteobacteria bacterium]
MSSNNCPLAIVGISCLFPKAGDLQTYWANIKNGVDAITPIPADSHWNAADYFDPDPKSPDRTYAQRGGFISPVDFNPMDFGIAPKDIEATDTTQLLSLVAAHRALADAGYAAGNVPGREYDHDRTSVILGVTGALELVIPLGARLGHPHWRKALKEAGVEPAVAEDVVQRISDSYVGWQENSFPGLLGNVAAGRIASRLDLGGTNCVVDAACASSLAAIHLAGMELATGRTDMVITGGVDTFNDIFMYMCFSKTPALSPTGDAKPFDRDCDGTVLGEGLGLLVLKRLADAERDGDRIYAVLKGTGSSSDGRSSAIYAPRAEGQMLALRRAYENAGVAPETIELVEAHGTGTKVGDATELSSLTAVFRSAQQSRSWCALGSVKSQIGHTKAAAGVAGIIKAALALHRKVLPPTIKINQPIDEVAPGSSPFYLNTSKRPWLPDATHPRRAGVSALGFGGTNFHCVLEEHDPAKAEVDWDGDVEIAAFSSERFDDLVAQINAFRMDSSWIDFRAAAGLSRQRFRHTENFRLLMVVSSESDRASLKGAALKMLEKNPEKRSWTSPSGIAFGSGKRHGKLGALFPGQGSQYPGMLRDLACQFPGMLDALSDADRAFAREHAQPGAERLSDFIYPHPVFSDDARARQEEALKSTDITQPALGAVSIGAFNVLNYFGVTAEAACGHSYGELLALCGAGRITPDALHQLSNLRGRLMARKNGDVDRGAMLAVQADEETVLNFLREDESPLVVANRNSPKQHVLAGTMENIEAAAGKLSARSIRSRVLQVAAAFHSPLVADARAPFAEALEAIAFAKGEMPVYANATGREYPKAAKQARELLASQIVRPVNFMEQVEAMHADGVRTFIEVGPGHVLSDLVQSILPGRDVETIALDASRGNRSGTFDLALALGRLASLGHEVNLAKWENAPAPAEARKAGKPALTMQLSGANYRAPHAVRPPLAAPAATPAPALLSPVLAARPVAPLDSLSSVTQPAGSSTQPSVTPPFAPATSSKPESMPAALRATQEGILALQRLQEQTAQLHKQFLEGQESARRTLHALLNLRVGPGDSAPAVAATPLAATPLAGMPLATPSSVPAPAVDRSAYVPAYVRDERAAMWREDPPPAHADHRSATAHSIPLQTRAVQTAAASDRNRYEQAVLEVVSEKTGYPVEMLTLGMGMDADLGIDSIKRVEIMAALRGRMPDAPEIKPEHLGSLQTLEQVVAFLASNEGTEVGNDNVDNDTVDNETAAIPAGASAVVDVHAGRARISAAVLTVVAEKTGYPVEMLNLEMGMDSDLGIDSIKRVEIMAALRGLLPDSPEIKPEHLGSLQTLEQVVAFLAGNEGTEEGNETAAIPVAVPAAPAATDAPHPEGGPLISATVLAVVAEKTGYPVEMLNLQMGMDSDLGIDSIKRVEIMAALRGLLPGSPEIKPEHLGSLQTLQQVVDFLTDDPVLPDTGPAADMTPITPMAPASPPVASAPDAPPQVLRQSVRPLALADDENRETISLPAGAHVWLTEDGSALSRRIEERLRARGLIVHRGDMRQNFFSTCADLPHALVILAPAAGSDETFLKHAFRLIKLAAPSLRKAGGAGAAILATVSRLDGAFGFGELGSNSDAISGGLAGLVKTAQREWPEVRCKAMDIHPGAGQTTRIAAQIADEMFKLGPIEVGLSGRNRITLDVALAAAPQQGTRQPIDERDVVIVTGGARGVTGDAALALARAFRPTLVLFGRTQLAETEPEWLQSLHTEAEIKKAFFSRLNGSGTPKVVESKYLELLARREIKAQMSRLEAAGAVAIYRSVDVRDGAEVARVIGEIRERHGAIRGLVHGAGVLADRRIEDKTEQQFDSVYLTKVTGLQNLLAALSQDELKVMALFSSYTGRFGRIGQADYAAANEVLNKLAQVESRRRTGCRVVSINWGPWNGGMVTPGLVKLFEQEGVGLIAPAAGGEFLVRELGSTEAGFVEVLALAAPPASEPAPTQEPVAPAASAAPAAPAAPVATSLAFEREVSVKALPCLESHVINGRAVLPAALMVEWLAQAALHGSPGMAFHGLDNFKVLKGIVLEPQQSVMVSLLAGAVTPRANLLLVPVRMISHKGDRQILHAEADVLLTAEQLPAAPAPVLNNLSGGGFTDAYTRGVLFHGTELHGIESVEGCAVQGVAATVKAAPSPKTWMRYPLRGTWIADPLALDSAFQMMILWSTLHRGAPSLPSALARYRQFVAAFPKGGCRVVIAVALGITAMAVASIEFLDRQGNLLASADGCECVVDANLHDAFRLNQLKLEK